MKIKDILCTAAGISGSLISRMFGGWSAALTTLVILMLIDYLTGVLAAVVGHNSPKSKSGGLESRAGWIGLVRKVLTLLLVLAAHRLDITMGTAYLKDAVTIAFCANECISLTENAGLMGIPIPAAIKNAIDILKGGINEDN